VTDLAQHSTDYSVVEREPPTVMGENLRIASRLWSSATVFFFFAFLFAYFYLRSLNQDQLWRPKGVDPSVALGTLGAAAVAVAATLLYLGLRDHRADRLADWRVKGGVALALLVAAIVLQVVTWATMDFGPLDGGFASVYIGWTSMEVLFLVGIVYWAETTVATSLRHGKSVPYEFEAGEASGDPHRTAPDIADPLSLVRPQLEAVSFFTAVFAGIVVVSWIVLYLL
jgi:heme/copper-type cytochrome/quinol oxidase subunit 3